MEKAGFGRDARLVGRASLGSGFLHVEGDAAVQAATIEALRLCNHVRHVTVVQADRVVRSRTELWGVPPERRQLLDAIKLALDPERILNAGRGPL